MSIVRVNVDLLRKTIEKSGLTCTQFNNSIGLRRCRKMVQNCFQRGTLRKDQAYAIIELYRLDEKKFILEKDENIHNVFKWVSSLDREQLIGIFGYESIDDLLGSGTPVMEISRQYNASCRKDKTDEFCNKFIELMDEYGLEFDDAVKAAAPIVTRREIKKIRENNA